MQKKLSERIAENLSKQKDGRQIHTRAIFLALRPEIEQAIQDGWSVKIIWETLKSEGKIKASYETFRNCVNQIISRSTPKQQTTKEPKTESEVPPTPKRKPQIVKAVPMPSFTYNSVPNKEELL